jgi:flagellar protein FlaG
MTDAIRPIGTTPSSDGPTPPQPEAAISDSAPRFLQTTAAEAAEPALPDTRLVIEEVDGHFVYKVLDRETGDVVLQLPREELVRLMRSGEYRSGSLFQLRT